MTKKLRLKAPSKKKVEHVRRRRSSKRRGASLEDLEARLEKASAVLAKTPETRRTYTVRVAEIRQSAGIDYITDPDARSTDYWHGRDDRPYKRTVALATFREWSSLDNWKSRREHFWIQVEDQVIEKKRHEILVQRLREVDELTVIRAPMMAYLQPLKNDDGTWQVHEPGTKLAGLPKYPLALPSMEKFVKSLIDLDKHLMLKRGEATARTDSLGTEGNSLDPVSSKASFSKDDIRSLSRYMLKMRQPELGDMEPIEIYDDVYAVEHESDGDDDDGE